LGVKRDHSWGKKRPTLGYEETDLCGGKKSTLGVSLNLILFMPQEDYFYPR